MLDNMYKYDTQIYEYKVKKVVEKCVDDLSTYVEKLCNLCNPDRHHIGYLKDITTVFASYTPGIPDDVCEVFKGVYGGPSLDVEVKTVYTGKSTGGYVEKSYTYMVMFDGSTGVVDNFSFYDNKVTNEFERNVEMAADAVYAQIPMFDFTLFNKALEPFIAEYSSSVEKSLS